MTKNEATKNKYKAEKYILCLIDVIGQREQLKNLENLERVEDFTNEILDSTIGVIEDFRGAFMGFLDAFESPKKNSIFETLGKEHQESVAIFKKMQKTKVTLQSFSDTILLYCPLDEEDGRYPVMDIYKILSAIAYCKLLFIGERGVFLRGGVDIGFGTKLLGGDFYGPALSQSYHLESKIANYFRIAVGKKLSEYLRDAEVRNILKSNPIEKFRNFFAGELRRYLKKDNPTRDPSENYIIDYLGMTFLSHAFIVDNNIQALIAKSYEKISQECSKYQKLLEENSPSVEEIEKRLTRYNKLKSYFEENTKNVQRILNSEAIHSI